MTELKAPTGVDKCSARHSAQEIAESMIISYWMDGRSDDTAAYHAEHAIDHMHTLAALFGAKLVPLDVDDTAPAVSLEDAGRGHLAEGGL